MTGSVSFPEIYLCEFPFTSGIGSKKRPSLVLFDLGVDVVIARITSVLYTGEHDLPIRDWKAAGLLMASTLRLSRLVTVEKSLLIRRLGELSLRDRASVITMWQTKMTLH